MLCVCSRSIVLVCTTVASPASVSQGFCRCPLSPPSLVVGAYSWGSPVPLPVVETQLTMCLTSIVYAVCRLICRHDCCCFAQPPAMGWSWLNSGLFALRARLNVFVRLGFDSDSSSLVVDSLSAVARSFSPPLGCKLCSDVTSSHCVGFYRHHDLVLANVF